MVGAKMFDRYQEDSYTKDSKALGEGERACACTKCNNCRRDDMVGLCEFILNPEKNMLCTDCTTGVCGSGISFTD